MGSTWNTNFVVTSVTESCHNATPSCTNGHWWPWWRHQMETFSALQAICAGNSPVTGEFPAQRPVTRSFDVFWDLRLNKRLSKQWCGWWFETPSLPLWRHCNDTGCCVMATLCDTSDDNVSIWWRQNWRHDNARFSAYCSPPNALLIVDWGVKMIYHSPYAYLYTNISYYHNIFTTNMISVGQSRILRDQYAKVSKELVSFLHLSICYLSSIFVKGTKNTMLNYCFY